LVCLAGAFFLVPRFGTYGAAGAVLVANGTGFLLSASLVLLVAQKRMQETEPNRHLNAH
jgi:O-antigen/teichoic acid export membrane protein